MKGIIFDFNGTLFYDTPKHIEAWREYSKRLRGTAFSDEEMEKHMLGHTNDDIIAYAIGKKPEKAMAKKLAAEKEAVYRDMCRQDMENTKLAQGAPELLDFLVEKNIPHTIATASDRDHVDFFIEIFDLPRWFEVEKIVFDDGFMPNKPAPDIYLKAAENIGLAPEDCIVFEDAIAGIEAAKNAGIGKIIAVVPPEKHGFFKGYDGGCAVISNFKDFDRSILGS